MYRQLKGAFKIDRFIFIPIDPAMESYGSIKQYSTMKEALTNCTGKRIFLEHTGLKNLSDIPTDEDIVLIVGNTEQNNIKHALKSETYRINTPGNTDLYGVNAAAIALAHRVN